MKKLLSICLAVLVVVGLVPVYALAEGTQTVTVTPPLNGTLAVTYDEGTPINGNAQIATGTTLTITATPTNGDTHELDSITIKGTTVDITETSSSASYTVGTEDVTIAATFKEKTPVPPTTHSITYTVTGDGTLTIAGESGLSGTNQTKAVNEGNVTVSAVPGSGQQIKTFTVGGTDYKAAGTATVNVTGDIAVVAEFEAIPATTHTVTYSVTGDGTLTIAGESGLSGTNQSKTVNEGNVTVSAVPGNGQQIKTFTVGGTDYKAAGTATVNVTGDIAVVAEFEAIPATTHTVTYSVTGDGTLTIAGESGLSGTNQTKTVNEGNVTVTAVPGSGQQIKTFTVGGTDYKAAGTATVNVTGNIAVVVEFEAIPSNVTTHKVTIKAPEDGKITVTYTDKDGNSKTATSGSVDIKDGTKIDVTTTPDTNYKLKTLTIGGTNYTTDQTGVAVTGDITVSASFEYNGGASTPTYVHRPLGVYDDEGDWLEDNSGSSFPRPSSDGKVVLDGVLPNQTFYIKLGDANSDLITTLSGGGKAHASDLADDSLFKISVDKDGDGKSLISKIEQVDEKRLGGMTRASYLKVTLKDMTSTDERKANAEIEFKAKKDKSGSWAKGETAILNLNMWISNTKVSGSDGDADTGDKIYFSPEANENNVLIWGDDRAALEFTADDDAKDFYARLSTRSMSDIYAEYGDPVDADLWFYDFVGNPSIPSTSRAYLTLGIPWDDDDDYSPDPRDVYIYRLDKDGYLEDVTAMFTYSEDDREIEGWTTRTRTLGTYIVSDTELDIDSYYDDDDDTEVPSIDVSNNQKPVPNTGR